jgi:hypothetical protein
MNKKIRSNEYDKEQVEPIIIVALQNNSILVSIKKGFVKRVDYDLDRQNQPHDEASALLCI